MRVGWRGCGLGWRYERVGCVIEQLGDWRRFSVLDTMLPWNWNGGSNLMSGVDIGKVRACYY